jgi:hypothetical protein
MRILTFVLFIVLSSSCKEGMENNPAFGAWKHVESKSDMGDGKATFHRVDSDKTLLFTAYGTVISNQNVCIGNNFKEGTVATWNPEEKSFNLDECAATYELELDGDQLIVNYQCMEACAEKYVREK